ncbi:MAG: hypothetical protein NE330_24210, partial [Lentisphaeraceae bacterium]|nr:hypothetical protein [Lentisphaeraceae bacterium]
MECIKKDKEKIIDALNAMDSETLVKELREARRKTIDIILFQNNQLEEIKAKNIELKKRPEVVPEAAPVEAKAPAKEAPVKEPKPEVVEEPIKVESEELTKMVTKAKETHKEITIEVSIPELAVEIDCSEDLSFSLEEAEAYLADSSSGVAPEAPTTENLELDQSELDNLLGSTEEPKKFEEVSSEEIDDLAAQLAVAR